MSRKSGNGVSLNQISFWLLVTAAILYVVGIILSAIGGSILTMIVGWLLAVATAMMVCVVAVLAWRYVDKKPAVWKVLYFIVLLIVIAGLVLPNVFGIGK